MYDHILFDADGTLWDFTAAENYALKALFEEAGLLVTDAMIDTYHTINHRLWLDLEKGLTTLEKLKVERFLRFYAAYKVDSDAASAAERYMYHLSTSYHIYDDTMKVLEEIDAMGISMSIITNGITEVQKGRVKATGTSRFFAYVAIGEELGHVKPDVRFFSRTFEKLSQCGIFPNRPLVVGDSLSSDIKGAQQAGLDSVWINRYGMDIPSSPAYTYAIHSLEELLSIIQL
ncbi:MAG: YjjG family noncanonical pyrimidine nucleotidase [Sphaerochaetaceae bacterium]|nr:YjjG family noncanonical pyrimidine nucleotidase [Sphaerochaetaceae bacterium]